MINETEDASTLRRMVWVFPDRESSRAIPKWLRAFWHAYEEVAQELGLTWTAHPPEDVAVDVMDRDDPRVYVAGQRVTPADRRGHARWLGGQTDRRALASATTAHTIPLP